MLHEEMKVAVALFDKTEPLVKPKGGIVLFNMYSDTFSREVGLGDDIG